MSTDTTETVEPHVIVERLSREIFASVLPHDHENDDTRYRSSRRSDLPEELLVPPVNATSDVKIGDILVLVESGAYGNMLRTYTALDAVVYQGQSELAVVVKTTSKQIVVRYVGKPWHNWRSDLAEFGKTLTNVDTRLSIDSRSREIGRLGSMEELREKLAAHPKFAEWQAARTVALDKAAADADARRAEEQAREAHEAPVKAAIEALNTILGEVLFRLSRGEVSTMSKWIVGDDFTRLTVYLAGLRALGRITDQQHTDALAHVRTIQAYDKGKQ